MLKLFQGKHYAIKRVDLPTNSIKMEQVLHEVKVLARLDHVNIVRYNCTWIETQPKGTQLNLLSPNFKSFCPKNSGDYFNQVSMHNQRDP